MSGPIANVVRRLRRGVTLTAALLIVVASAPVPSALAAGTVISICDQGHLASAVAGGGTVTFACSGTIALTSTISVTQPTVLDGSGRTIVIDGGGTVGLFEIGPVPLGVIDMTLRNGHALTGGAIDGLGSVSANGVTFANNTSIGDGGAIDAYEVAVTNSTFVVNQRGLGSAIVARDRLDILSSTFVGGQIELDMGSGSLRNTILIGSPGSTLGDGECYFGYLGHATVVDGGGNFSDDTSCGFTQPTSHGSVPPASLRLGSLASNGGPTQTIALLPGSVAIDAGVSCPPPATDQRGIARPHGAACDSGAFEAASQTTLVVFLQGWTSSLPSGPDSPNAFKRTNGLAPRLGSAGITSLDLRDFSYSGASSATFGADYGPCDSLRHVNEAEAILDLELKGYAATHHDVDVYLVGHSQGGVVALGYLAWLAKLGRSYASPFPGMRLAGVVTLDSPLGGVVLPSVNVGGIPVSGTDLTQAFLLSKCSSSGLRAPGFADLMSLGAQSQPLRGWPWGATGSIARLFGVTAPSDNQAVANAAAAAGVRTLSIGNIRDLAFTSSGLGSTQWLTSRSDAGVFSRAIDVPDTCVLADVGCQLAHGAVLTDQATADAVIQFIRGGTPSLSPPQSPFDFAVSATWDAAGGVLTAGNGLIRLAAGGGSVASSDSASLTSVSVASIPDPVPTGQAIVGPAVSVTLPALTSGSSATLTLPISLPAFGTASSAAIFRDGVWVRMPTKVDLLAGTATATITEGGVYAPLTESIPKVVLQDAIAVGIRRGNTGFTTRAITVPAGSWVTYKVVSPRLAGKTLSIWSRAGSSPWRKVATRAVGSDGTVRFYARVHGRTTFRATWLGDDRLAPATSHGRSALTR